MSPQSWRVSILVLVLLTRGLSPAFAAMASGNESKPGELLPPLRQVEPEIDPASDEARLAMTRMKLPDGFVATLWAAEPMLANPVAFNLDERGRVFVAETYRYRTSVLDIRDYMWMLEDDLANRDQDDFLATIRRNFGADGVAELSKESEILRLLEDTDGDGVADKSSIYADDFRSPIDGIASGVLIRGDDVWFTNIPALWKFTGRDRAETREELHRGYGIRFNFTGHDFHGLVFGPDGKIYFSIGDRAASVPTREGTTIHAPDTGSVFRCNFDGTELELFATGMRNPQSLIFNEYGDLFTGDNDSDQEDQERLVHVVEGGDSGWRIGYQFAPRGNAGPWNAEKLWWPRHAEQPAYLLPPICNVEDGPSGIAYYPGTGLTPEYGGRIFLTHFKGAITHSGIFTYKLKPAGASYAIEDADPFLTGALPTDVRFGPDGKLYYSDWAEGWPKSRRGRIYTIFDPSHANDPRAKETQRLLGGEIAQKDPDELRALLAHADWRVRLEAQYRLAERGASGVAKFAAVLTDAGSSPLARRHAVWGLGQLAAKHPAALEALRSHLQHTDGEVRAQVAKTLGDRRDATSAAALVNALDDPAPRVQFFAAQAVGKLRHAAATPVLFEKIRANNDADVYLRHALVMGLVGCATTDELAAVVDDPSRAVRLASVLALRRRGEAEIAAFLSDRDPFITREAALAINDAPIVAAYPALAALLENPVNDTPTMLRAINAAYRVGTAESAAALAQYAARDDMPENLREEALTLFTLWTRPPARDRLVGIYRPLPQSRPADVPARALAPHIARLVAASNPESVQLATTAAIAALEIRDAAATMHILVRDETQRPAVRAAALTVLDKLGDPRLDDAVQIALADESGEVRLAALPISSRLHPDAAVTTLARLLDGGTPAEQRAAFRALGDSAKSEADTVILEQLARLREGAVAPAAQLELLEAAAKRSDPRIKQALNERDAALAQTGDPLAPFRSAMEGGDPRAGARVFYGHPVVACIRCHRTSDNAGSEAGPNLAGIGARESREYILESIIKPSAKIAPGFAIATITRKDGEALVGTIARENEDEVHLRIGEDDPVVIPRSEIAGIDVGASAMPELAGIVLSKAEIRDLMAFVTSLTKPARPNNEKPIRALLPQPQQ